MKKILFVFGLIFVLGLTSMVKAGPGRVRDTKLYTLEVISDSTIDGFVSDLIVNTDTNFALIVKWIEVEFDTGTAYTSAGSDTVFVFTRTDADTSVVAYLDYPLFVDTLGFTMDVNLEEVRTNGLQYWIDSPASEFAVGDRNYTLRVYYVKRRKVY